MSKKYVALTSIQIMSNRKEKNFGDKIKNSAKIKAYTTSFWLIIKKIKIITLMMSMEKQIIQKAILKRAHNIS